MPNSTFRRLERLSRHDGMDMFTSSATENMGRPTPMVVTNLDLTPSSLNLDYSIIVKAPRPRPAAAPRPLSPRSFISSKSSRTVFSTSSSFAPKALSPESIRSYQSARSEIPQRHRTSLEDDATPQRPSFTSTISSSITSRTTPPFRPSPDSAPSVSTKHVHVTMSSYTPRPSLDSLSRCNSSSSFHTAHSFLDVKERKAPPPPLHLDSSNLHPGTTAVHTIVGNTAPTKASFEIGAPSSQGVESRRSSYFVTSPLYSGPCTPSTAALADTPSSPDFQMPSEEEVFRRRHEKVMRTLGERVPVDLISSSVPRSTPVQVPTLTTMTKANVLTVPKILNVTVFPEPPSPPSAEMNLKTSSPRTRIARRASITISNVAANLLPSAHVRNKSREILGLDTLSASTTPTSLNFPHTTRPREVLITPRSASSTSYRPDSTASFSNSSHSPISPQVTALKDSDHATRLARRASISTPTFLPTSPMRGGFRGSLSPNPLPSYHKASSPSRLRRSHLRSDSKTTPTTTNRDSVYVDIDTTRPESMLVLSPLVFAKQASLLLPEFKYVVNGEDIEEPGEKVMEEGDGDDWITDSRKPPPIHQTHNLYVHSDMGHGHSSRYAHSNPHLPLLPPRAETPSQDGTMANARAETPDPVKSEAWLWSSSRTKVNVNLAGGRGKKESSKGKSGPLGRNLVQRKERRQGWSGEWNQGDMQDVIAKLRNLK